MNSKRKHDFPSKRGHYMKTSDRTKKALIKMVFNERNTIAYASEELNIKLSTAKSIIRSEKIMKRLLAAKRKSIEAQAELQRGQEMKEEGSKALLQEREIEPIEKEEKDMEDSKEIERLDVSWDKSVSKVQFQEPTFYFCQIPWLNFSFADYRMTNWTQECSNQWMMNQNGY